jgi:hypothetical protein
MADLVTSYQRSYTSFSGADIVATFDGYVIGELQAISYSVTREKAPIYTMGSADPRSFSRGKRGIAGSMVFTVFNKDTLLELKKDKKVSVSSANARLRENLLALNRGEENPGDYIIDVEDWESWQENSGNTFERAEAYYVDEIPPFDITITLQNEYGQAARFSILGVEILNEGSGMSIDDITTERACTFVARSITPLEPITTGGSLKRD